MVEARKAAHLLLSVSPTLSPIHPPPHKKKMMILESRFNPLTSLATLAALQFDEEQKRKERMNNISKDRGDTSDEDTLPSVIKQNIKDEIPPTTPPLHYIGRFSPVERQGLLIKFHAKRKRRVWKKKIRYGCRKNLADNRIRVKGRFVGRSAARSSRTGIRLHE